MHNIQKAKMENVLKNLKKNEGIGNSVNKIDRKRNSEYKKWEY